MIDLHPAAQRTIDVLTSVTDEQLELPTPCPDASVGDVVDHPVATAGKVTPDRRWRASHGGIDFE
jgi:hypothetical protein